MNSSNNDAVDALMKAETEANNIIKTAQNERYFDMMFSMIKKIESDKLTNKIKMENE